MLALGLQFEEGKAALGLAILGFGFAQAHLHLLHRGAGRIELRFRLGKRETVGLGIEHDQYIAFLHVGMVADVQANDPSLHFTRHLHDIRLDEGVLVVA